MFEVFEHTADLGLRVRATTREELFQDAARGLFSIIVANLDQVRSLEQREYALAGEELDYLLFDWLNELLYTFESERLLLAEFEVSLTATGLQARARGEPIDPQRHRLEHEVKAITYHRFQVVQANGEWSAEIIVDI